MMTETANDQIMLRSFICSWMHGRYILRRFARIVLKALYMRSLIGAEPVLGVGWIVYPESLMQGRILN
ncbi:hypothetical protein SETIT_2G054300v2 [Setaria italica]|uniref:Uncharacterized protein n=1 Tax=Setaria italica TaxID=4555 RepID=A0A368PVC7_SETIT|nr:hypothetical protein SETIT_2G054300v2 [Setaria italica]